MMGKEKKLAPLLVTLAILLITTVEMVPEVVAGDDLQCNVWWPLCSGVCYKAGKCMRCCKHYGYFHGRCSLIHGDACYCCHGPNSGQQQQGMLRVIERSPPPRRPPPIQGSRH
ncbi:uncharacterized protein LOC100839710 [Brachypodium distachyon]|uniref:Knottin scorpion toxin-like domain-containing protein n=1 Tax=Brachypodium distachyon TaxID=15368 RepID=I1HW72_BRADI|nr:uncharacterized protein LOC100839710 [Brachypodium distachyon]KQJ92835.1 hypothetical protein BRADI_3g01000v3 [Brachypodium distachyon]|eukprot:XP_003571607.1 uncharacterized protein LOC100839710 [Brachypodium distachyon]